MAAAEIEIAGWLVTAAHAWVGIGLALAAVFLGWGIDRVESNARGAYAFRPLLVPGIVLLWPLVLWRWIELERGRDQPLERHRPPRGAHAAIWRWLAPAIPAILLAGLLVRTDGPLEAPAVMIAPPTSADEGVE